MAHFLSINWLVVFPDTQHLPVFLGNLSDTVPTPQILLAACGTEDRKAERHV